MRIVMLGTGPFAVPTLRALAASAHQVVLTVTRPPQDRRGTPSPIQQTADELQLEVWDPPTVNSPEVQARLAGLSPDLLVVCDYGEILKPQTLATARLGGINLHGSLLPKYRGAAPVQWAMLRGDAETGNSVIHMTPGLDAGPLLLQQRTPIDPDEDSAQLEKRLAAMGADAVLEVIESLAAGSANPVTQDVALASKAPRLKKEQGAIDWSRSSREIKNQVQALRPWPRAYTFWLPSTGTPIRLNIDRVSIADRPHSNDESSNSAPGRVVKVSPHFAISTGDGVLLIEELQPAGKRSMSAADFLRGNRVNVGDQFGPER